MGIFEPDEVKGEPLVLRSDDVLLTSLFGWDVGGVLVPGNMGVVEPAMEKDCDTAAEPGLE